MTLYAKVAGTCPSCSVARLLGCSVARKRLRRVALSPHRIACKRKPLPAICMRVSRGTFPSSDLRHDCSCDVRVAPVIFGGGRSFAKDRWTLIAFADGVSCRMTGRNGSAASGSTRPQSAIQRARKPTVGATALLPETDGLPEFDSLSRFSAHF
jgi:hypothetical protein